MRTVLNVAGLIALGVGSRLLPHLPNMTALGAISARSVERFGPRGLLIPVAALLISDVVLGWYDWRLLVSVYLSFALVGVTVHALSAHAPRSIAALSGSFTFFLTTNTVVWATSSWYPGTVLGLVACYAAGLPFLVSMAAGDVLYSHVLNLKPTTLFKKITVPLMQVFSRRHSGA